MREPGLRVSTIGRRRPACQRRTRFRRLQGGCDFAVEQARMSTEMPPVELRNRILVGYEKFLPWALNNIPEYRAWFRTMASGQCSIEQAQMMIAVELARKVQVLAKRVGDLELIAPRKMRFPDGSIRVYRAPEDLLPLEEAKAP